MKLYLHFFLEFENRKVKGMELELPNRLYGEGLEPQVKKINNSCRLKLLELLKEKMEPEFDEVMKDPIFSQIMVIQKNDLKFSARLVHSFLCKEFNIQIDRSTRSGHHSLFKGLIDSDLLTKLIRHEN
ncbi:hypothetical protein Bca4012_089021 [Brassica carinata]